MRLSFLIAILAIPLASCGKNQPSDRLDDSAVAANATRPSDSSPTARCSSNATYALIKRELFRRAAEARGSNDVAGFDRLARTTSLRVERPVVESDNDGLGSISCSASVALDLPPGATVAGGRRSLVADLDYVLQPAADGTGDVVTLARPEAITVPLATLALTQPPANPIPTPPTSAPATPDAPPPPVVVHRKSPAPAPAPDPLAPIASARPSFNCARARTSSERTICQDDGLAALDRRMAANYSEAMREADPGTRAFLQQSRDRFLRFRDRCASADCIADTYRGRMREIDDIASGRLQ